jgi:hypothetical protein
MKAYQTDSQNFYIGEVNCQESPLEPGVFLMPGGCIDVAPPSFSENEIAYWNGSSWEIKPDFSGVIYYSKTDKSEKTFEKGEDLNSDYTTEKPLENEQFQKFDGVAWVIDEEAKLQFEKTTQLNKLKGELASSDWRMTVDKYNAMTLEEQKYWTDTREALRVKIREYDKQ